MAKNFKSYVLSALAVAAIAFSSCSKSDEGMTPAQKKDFSVVLSGVSTKTTNNGMKTEWKANDAINLFHCVAGTTTYVSDGEFKTSDNGATATFKGTLAEGFDDTKTYNWYAIYPYNKYNTTPANTGDDGYVVIGSKSNAKQSQTGNNSTAHISGTNYPVAGVVEKIAGTEKPSFTMKHLTALVAITVKNGTTAPITVSNVALTSDPITTPDIVGTYFIDFASSGTPVYKKSGDTYVSNTASLEVKNGEEIAPGKTATFYMAVKPFQVANGDDFTVSITGSNGVDEKTITSPKDFDFEAGKVKTINYTYTNTVATYDFEDCATINQLAEAAGSTETEYFGKLTNAVISFVGNTQNAIIKDASGSALVYKSSHGLKQGQTFSGTMTIKVKAYQGLNEITAIDASFTGTETNVDPEELTVAQLIGNYSTYQNAYAKLTGLEVTAVDGKNVSVKDGTNAYLVFTNYGNASCAVGDKITVLGTVTRHNTDEELKVWKADDITVTYHAPTTHKVTFTQPTDGSGSFTVSVDGSNISTGADVMEGKTVTITATANSGYKFSSWTVSGATPASTTFEMGSSDVAISASFVSAGVDLIDFSTLGLTNGTAYNDPFTQGDFTITFPAKGNNGKYYTSGTAIRSYGGCTFIVASTTKTISKIELTYGADDGTNAITANVGTFSTDTWTGSAKSVTFTVGGTSGHRRIKAVKVTYSD